MKYECLDNHRGEILRPGTLIKILYDNDYPVRAGGIFKIVKHIAEDKYKFKIVHDITGAGSWDFDWEFNHPPHCTIIKTEKTIEDDPEYEGLFI